MENGSIIWNRRPKKSMHPTRDGYVKQKIVHRNSASAEDAFADNVFSDLK